MGDIMQTITAGQLADELGVNPQTMEKRVRRKFPALSPALSAHLSQEQVRVLSAGRAGKKTRKKRTGKPDNPAPDICPETDNAQNEQPFDFSALRRAAFDIVCILITVAHAGLIWYDCSSLWSAPGLIGGGMAFLIVIAAVLICTDNTRGRTSEAALWVVGLVDAAAWFVHFPTFQRSAQIGDIQTGALCGFICIFSFAALYLYRDSKID